MSYSRGDKTQRPKQGSGYIQSYLATKLSRSQHTFTYESSGIGYYTVNGNRISESEFNKLFPLTISNGRERLDSRQNYY